MENDEIDQKTCSAAIMSENLGVEIESKVRRGLKGLLCFVPLAKKGAITVVRNRGENKNYKMDEVARRV